MLFKKLEVLKDILTIINIANKIMQVNFIK